MNNKEFEIMNAISESPCATQRELADVCGCSLGIVNRGIKDLMEEGCLDREKRLTAKARCLLDSCRPKRAVILAAGYGLRMVPINRDTPKGLLEVHGERLIERLIRQLHEKGIREIHVVVGYQKEQYEYLIDAYDVNLIVNVEYATKNNLSSLARVGKYLANAYIVPCDIWCRENPFRASEGYSWYMVTDRLRKKSRVRANRKNELVVVSKDTPGNSMTGICFLREADAAIVRDRVECFNADEEKADAFWEDALYEKERMIVSARVVPGDSVVAVNTYEQLRELDKGSVQLRSEAISSIAAALDADPGEIVQIKVLKKGMTNRSFLFTCRGEKYIMRIPGEGTDQLISRREEATVYAQIGDRGISDDVICLNPENGFKITRYLDDTRVCDPLNREELKICIGKLKEFHAMELQVGHTFDLFGQIEFYETLWNGMPSIYKDYQKTKAQVLSLKDYIDRCPKKWILTHIDANPDNFLFYRDGAGQEQVRLIDWEYAGMQDPHVDVAMFGIYAMYDREHMDDLIDLYFDGNCPAQTRVKIYCYIACCGLLWSNWCEYKRTLGVEFGEYSLRQYRYAKDYYRIAMKEMEALQK